jgi:acetolactate synthase-1/2/3 large subunit
LRQCADLIFEYLKNIGVSDVFMLTGGGAMYLIDSLGRSGINYVCCHHEQSAAIAAQAYSMYDERLGVCLVTTGPGGTNALTGAAAAYMDSSPVLFISGQVKRGDFADKRGVRQFGAQENDILAMAKPITKYAVCVTDETRVLYEIEKAVYIATHDRKGPVWVDIPLDVQSAMVDERLLEHFKERTEFNSDEILTAISNTADLLKSAERPLFLVGHGILASKSEKDFINLANELKIPVLTTWRALSLFDYEDKLFFGSPGLQAPRYSNLILQSCDLLIVLGSRLDNMITAFNENNFAKSAKKIIIDIDFKELSKFKIPNTTIINADVKDFITEIRNFASKINTDKFARWTDNCLKVKENFPIWKEKQVCEKNVDLYKAALEISQNCTNNDCVVISSTSRCNTAGHIAFKHKAGQRCISSMGFGSMGFALPSVIGAYYASNKQRVIMLEGDGSFQLNLQELQTIVSYKIPAKMFIFSNRGYAAIATMQDRNFDGRHVGSDKNSGVSMPDLKKIACAYNIPYFCINSDNEIISIVREVMSINGAVICEIAGDMSFDEIPKCISYVDKNGQRVSAPLENPFPFLQEDELLEIIGCLKN